MTLGERIKKIRNERKMTQRELAEKIDISQQSLQRIESGETKTTQKVIDIARALNTTPEYLQFGVDNNVTAGPIIKNHFPLIDWVQAGDWTSISEINPADADYFACPVNCSKETFVLKIQGVSMEPQFLDGDLIFVDPLAEWINKSYVVARLDNENTATFKQLIIEGDQKFLKALNPDWPTPMQPINGNCRIVGKVVFAGKAL